MKTIRTRMLVVFATAAVVISIFVNWSDVQRGFDEGRGRHKVAAERR